MNRILLILFIATIAILALLTALASAGASMANGVAQAASATALMTSQCVSAFLVFTAVFAGITIGVGASAFLSNRRQRPIQVLPGSSVQPISPYLLPHGDHQPRLPASPQSQPVYYLAADSESDNAEEEAIFQGWGW